MQDFKLQFPASLEVTGQAIDLSALSKGQKEFYVKLLSEIVDICRSKNKTRVVLGIAGPTGAGKSVVAVLLKHLAKQASLPFVLESITIDAYHYPNSYLNTHFADGVPLKRVKGRFDTYNTAQLAQDLAAFAAGETVAFPAYSRKLHDPVENSLIVEAKAALLVVEGLWLLYDEAGWETVGRLLDYAIFIEADIARAREAVLKRHITGGRSLEDAARHYEQVDARNSNLVMTTRHKANKVIPPYYSV